MKAIELKVKKRDVSTKGALHALRAQGEVPGILYGRGLEATPVKVGAHDLRGVLATGTNPLIELTCAEPIGESNKWLAVVAELQRHPTKSYPLHVDFHAIDLAHAIEAHVPVELTGQAKGVELGGVVEPLIHELHVRALPDRIPQAIQVDVSALGIGEHIAVAAIQIRGEFEILNEPSELVVTVLAPRLAQEELAAEEEEATGPTEQA